MIALMLSMYKMGISEIKAEFEVTSKENFKYYFITNEMKEEYLKREFPKGNYVKSKLKGNILAIFVY